MNIGLAKTINKLIPNLNLETRRLFLKKLPIFYEKAYNFEELMINNHKFLVAKVQDKSLGPKDFKKHLRILTEIRHEPVIWFLKELHPNKMKRMIENGLNFVIDNKQVHLPALNTSIKNEVVKKEEKTELTGTSINLLIREILQQDLSGKNKKEIASLMGITMMGAGRGLEPLIANDLCEEEVIGVRKIVKFQERDKLWKFILDKAKSPVAKEIYLDREFKEDIPLSGISALSNMTMLIDEEIKTYAIYKRNFRDKIDGMLEVIEDDAKIKVQLWDREPILIENDCINIIDIFLINRELRDERVEIELEELLGKSHLELGK
ncbi:MAG: hypothetical protein H6620_10520 [Halobacteriovoraceae bacterium]|nr:hypothetical protein [Halobacteriovoraceae bacterium]